MDKTVAGVLGAVGALVAGVSAQASPANVLQAESYAELLRPIPNAAATLRALETQEAAALEQVQYYYPPPPRPYYYHHHHHHHFYRPRYYYHHHHHHHHHGYGRYDYYR